MDRMTTSFRRRAWMLTAVVATLLVPNPAANAHTITSPTIVTIDVSNDRLFGEVQSPRKRCRRNREVMVKRARNDKPDATIGRTVTNGAGEWGFDLEGREGRFYAVAPGKVSGGYGHVHRCRRDESRAIRVS